MKQKSIGSASDLATALEDFRQAWWRAYDSGLRADISLPPMNSLYADAAVSDASDHYWGCKGRAHADLKVHRKLMADTRLAIATAAASKPSRRGKASKAEVRAALLKRDGSDCWVCAMPLQSNITIEHKIALANGGTWALDNLVLAHGECNRSLGRLPLKAKNAVRKALRKRPTKQESNCAGN